MILATVVLLFQIPTVAPMVTPAPKPAAQAILADYQAPSFLFAPQGASTDSEKPPTHPSLFDRDNIRLLPPEATDSNIRAANETLNLAGNGDGAEILATIHIPKRTEALPSLPDKSSDVRRSGSSWLLLAIAQHSAATFDAWTTNRALARGYVEENPLLRPVAGTPAIYGVIQIAPTLFDYVGRRMRPPAGLLRRAWWLPQTLGMSVSLYAGAHNLIHSH